MCGRFFLARRALEIAQALGLPMSLGADRWEPRYNIAPTQDVLTVVAHSMGLRLMPLRWGLIPEWAEYPAIGNEMFNARLETIASEPSYGRPFRNSRCIVLADGFFEWRKDETRKSPVMIRPKGRDIIGFAGVATLWRPPDGPEVLSCAIITRPAEGPVSRIHDRMPAILSRKAWESWADPELQDPVTLMKLLETERGHDLETVEVSTLVNSPKNDGPEVLEPA